MDFKKLLEKRKQDGTAKSVIRQIKTNWEVDETIVGRLVDIQPVHFEETQNDVNGYVFETNEGLQQFILGAAVDLQQKTAMPVGRVYACTFKGKIEISKGRSMNIFDVVDLGEYDGDKNKDTKTSDSGQAGKKH